MNEKYVCVLDMDETLGFYEGTTFHVRPQYHTLIQFLQLINADIILWSLGADNYVQRVVNGFLPELAKHAVKIFARSESEFSKTYYQYAKASEHIRDYYLPTSVFLMAVDDRVNDNMDNQYDLRISVKPYTKVNSCDKELLKVIQVLINGISTLETKHVQRGSILETDLQSSAQMEDFKLAPAA
ncbi:hypothetical protein JTE90_016329 [Oedothorax gibbosus]|uniref:FCP1 homology domain-containing protein n=1 Tax=Oedothorax gibbosus TaxID=931172 RepID=A0AAV6TR00_9ARAC|nr:hypothetical protein JTE90_016329 [Oedothorax gibbosus]